MKLFFHKDKLSGPFSLLNAKNNPIFGWAQKPPHPKTKSALIAATPCCSLSLQDLNLRTTHGSTNPKFDFGANTLPSNLRVLDSCAFSSKKETYAYDNRSWVTEDNHYRQRANSENDLHL